MTENNAAQEDILVRLNEIHADAGYLFGRAAADGSCAGAMAEAVRTKIDAVKALLSKLRAEGVQAGDERVRAALAALLGQWEKYKSSEYQNQEDAYNRLDKYARPLWQEARAALASAPVADERALDLLDKLFTAYENGTPCYEEPDSQGGYLGMAFRIDDDTFRACADLLNKQRPRTAGALASAPASEDGLTAKQAWWAGYRAGKGLPPDTPRQDAVKVDISSARLVTHWRNGTPRDERDTASDPEGKLIHDPTEHLLAASAPVAGEACAWFTEDHLTDKSATTWDRTVAERWRAKGWPVQSLYAAPQASEADALIDALGQCRDAFPLPDIVGSKLDLLWQEAMSDPSAVPAYIKARAALSAQPSGNPGELAAQPGAQKTGGSE